MLFAKVEKRYSFIVHLYYIYRPTRNESQYYLETCFIGLLDDNIGSCSYVSLTRNFVDVLTTNGTNNALLNK